MLREIERSKTQAEAERLLGQLKPRGRHEKDVRANADVVLVGMIAGAALMLEWF